MRASISTSPAVSAESELFGFLPSTVFSPVFTIFLIFAIVLFLWVAQGFAKRAKFFAAIERPLQINLKTAKPGNANLQKEEKKSDDDDAEEDDDNEETDGNVSLKARFSTTAVTDNIDTIIMGAGNSGLAAAVALSKLGERVLVLEQNAVAGGSLHTFKEAGCEFDTGFHYVGAKFVNMDLMNKLCHKTLELRRYHHYDRIAFADGDHYDFVAPEKKWVSDLQIRFPEYCEQIKAYANKVRRATRYLHALCWVKVMFPLSISRVLKKLICLYYFDVHGKSTYEVFQTVGIPEQTKIFDILNAIDYNIGGAPRELPFVFHAAMIHDYAFDGSFYPANGVRDIVQSLVNSISYLGGKVLMKASVERILLNGDGSVKGVRVRSGKDGVEILCKKIISGAGIPATLNALPESARWKSSPSRSLAPYDDKKALSDYVFYVAFEVPDQKDENGEEKDNGSSGSEKKKSHGIALPSHNIWLVNERNEFDGFISVPAQKQAGDGVGLKKQTFIVVFQAFTKDVIDFRVNTVKRKSGYEEHKRVLEERWLKVIHKHYPQLEKNGMKLIYKSLGTPLTNETFLGRFSVYGRPVNMDYTDLDPLNFQTPVNGLFVCGEDVLCPGIYPALVTGIFCAGKSKGLVC